MIISFLYRLRKGSNGSLASIPKEIYSDHGGDLKHQTQMRGLSEPHGAIRMYGLPVKFAV